MQKKASDKTQYPHVIKTPRKVGLEGIYLNMIKVIYVNPMANVILNGDKWSFSLKSGTREGCSLSPLLFNMVLEF